MGAIRLFLTVLLTIGLIGTAQSVAWGGDERADVWTDGGALARHLEAACRAVERTCGVEFRHPLSLHLSRQEQVLRMLDEAPNGQQGVLELSPNESERFLAYYDPMSRIVHILPEELRRVAELCSVPGLLHEEVLRVILVHEATHALDFERFPLRWTRACCAAVDERLATEAVLEGHAQLVAREVARRWEIEDAFECLTSLYTGAPGTGGSEEALGYDQEAPFVYVQGLRFMQEVKRVQGDAGIEAALRDPPAETRIIERPELWLDPPTRGRTHDLQALVEVFRSLAPSPDWGADKWRILGPPRPPEMTGRPVSATGNLDNHSLFLYSPDGSRYVNMFVTHCQTLAQAHAFVQGLEGVDQGRDLDPEWKKAVRRRGAGPDGILPGFFSSRRKTDDAPTSEMTMRVALQGRHVLEVTTYGQIETPPAALDRALFTAASMLASPPSLEIAHALEEHVRQFILAREARDRGAARAWLRDLLPSAADLRRVVRQEYASAFEGGYAGVRLGLRNDPVKNVHVDTMFDRAGSDAQVRAWAATTEQLAAGQGTAAQFPEPMRAFAKRRAAPGTTWVVLRVTKPGSPQPAAVAYFARFADRFLWLRDPWTVLR